MPSRPGRARRILGLVLLVPPIELVLLILVASRLGAAPVLAVVAVSGLLGLVLMRAGTPRAWRTLRELAGRGPTPDHHLSRQARGSTVVTPAGSGLRQVGVDLTEDALFLAAALMIAWPGLVTTVVGLVLILAPVRRALARRLEGRAERATTARVRRMAEQQRARLAGDTVLRGQAIDRAEFVRDPGPQDRER